MKKKPSTYATSAGIILLVCLLLFLALLIGIRSASDMKEVVISQFNEQQLILARQISRNLRQNFNEVWYELKILASVFPFLIHQTKKEEQFLSQTFVHLKKIGVKGIWIVDLQDNSTVISQGKIISQSISYVKRKDGGWFLDPLVLVFKYQISPQYVVFAYIDSYSFAKKVAAGIKSGKTGYAWIINDKGYFIYHPIKRFIGQNAFTIRQKMAPDFYFKQINKIQRIDMLEGKEGTGEYISMWHRNMRGRIKKIMAYSPLYIPHTDNRIWSIAVCAPENEIHESIRKLYIKEFFVQGTLILALIFIGISVIATERKFRMVLQREIVKKTQTLQESEERYRLLIESADDLILTLDEAGRIISINKATTLFFDRDNKFLLNESFSSVMQWPEEEFKRAMEKIVVEGKSILKEHPVKIRGKSYWLNTKLMPLNIGRGAREILCIARDVTREKEVQNHLSHTEKLASLGTLAAGVAHEINNPLGIIIGFGELLLENLDKESQSREDVEIILKHAHHCKEIVENLLNFARNTQGFYEATDVNDALEEIISIISHTLEINNIVLSVSYTKGLPLVRGDRRKLQQVFLNLIINAMDAMPRGGKLEVSTSIERNEVIIKVMDTGCGIKAEHQERIFDPFFTTKPEGKGTGLGLSISYGIINTYGGSIEVESEEGQGSIFTIKLPRVGED